MFILASVRKKIYTYLFLVSSVFKHYLDLHSIYYS